ncbi:MAG: tetratricopeptide repeat protein [Telluria sp.]
MIAATAAAGAVGEVMGNLVQGMVGNEAHIQVRQVLQKFAAKLRDGRLPENHDLQQAATDALTSALHALALGIALHIDPKPPLVDAIRRHLRDRTLFDQPLLELRRCPEREWLLALHKLLKKESPFGKRGALAVIPEGELLELFSPTVNQNIAGRLHAAARDWLGDKLDGEPGRPAVLDNFLANGWPLEKNGRQYITLYQAWSLFFHEQIKDNERVFRFVVVSTLADCRRNMVELSARPLPDFAVYQSELQRNFAEPLLLLKGIDEKADRILAKLDELAPRAHHACLHQLPQVPENFVGRENMVDRIADDLRAAFAEGDRRRLTRVIQGAGGLGKSAVAIAIGHALSRDFPDMQLFVRLRTHSGNPLAAEQARNSLLQQVYPGWDLPPDEDARRLAYQSLFIDANGNPRPGVLILDDCKHDAQLRALMPDSPCPVIVTSRRAFASGTSDSIPKLDPVSAVRLLSSIYPDLGIPGVGNELARLCGYFPIALRAAAGFLKRTKRKASGILEYLDELRANPLERLDDEDPESNTRLVLEYSYNGLADADSRTLRALSIISADFDRRAACAIGDCRGKTIDLFAELHLIEVDPDTGRYDWHDLLRALVAEKLGAGEGEAAHLRYVRHYSELARTASTPFIRGQGDFTTSYRLFDDEQAHIEAAMNWLLLRPDLCMERCTLADALHSRLLRFRFSWPARSKWYDAVISSAERIGMHESEANARFGLGQVARMQCDTATACRHYQAALTLYRATGNRSGEALAHCGLGDAMRMQNDFEAAREHCETARALYRTAGHLTGEADALAGLAEVATWVDSSARAREHFHAALGMYRAAGYRTGEATALKGLGIIAVVEGDTIMAREHFKAALAIFSETGYRSGEADTLTGLGDVARMRMDPVTARRRYDAALAIYRSIGNGLGEANALCGLGEVEHMIGNDVAVCQHLEAAFAIYRRLGSPIGTAGVLKRLNQLGCRPG